MREYILEGLKESGTIIINRPIEEAEEFPGFKTYAVNAFRIALDELGGPIYNTPMIGALIGATKIISLESIKKAIYDRFSKEIAERNIKAIERGYKEVKKVK